MEEYINGCYTKYGTRPLAASEIKYKTRLPNGMWCVIGYIPDPEDGISADVYRDKALKDLVFMEHGYTSSAPSDMSKWKEIDFQMVLMGVEARCERMKI